jgi:hypothetical protein
MRIRAIVIDRAVAELNRSAVNTNFSGRLVMMSLVAVLSVPAAVPPRFEGRNAVNAGHPEL